MSATSGGRSAVASAVRRLIAGCDTPGVPASAPRLRSHILLPFVPARSAMTDISARMKSEAMKMHVHSPGVVLRSLVIGLTAFLTVVDLFATQAILPSLTRHYNV